MKKTTSLERPLFMPETLEIFLVYGTMFTGGIETLILRLAEHLAMSGFRTTIYCTTGGELQASVHPKVAVINYDDVPDLLRRLDSQNARDPVGDSVLVLSFDATSAARAVLLDLALPKSVRVMHLTGVFHPKSYFMTGQPADRIFLNELLVCAIGVKNIFFMNEECRLAHAKKWRVNLSSSPVIALPIDQHEAVWRPGNMSCLRIVSVGRLVDFKAYNLGAMRILKNCRERGIAVSWDIYGYGPLETEMKALAEAMEVSEYVCLKGKLDYKNFSTVVAGYDLFIGMGTSVIEAAALGVPSICAIVDEKTSSYGYVSDLPFGNVGEMIEGRHGFEIEDLINGYVMFSAAERMQLSKKEVEAARRYAMPEFLQSLFNMAVAHRPPMGRMGRRFIAGFYYLMTDGLLARLLFGRGLKTKLMKLVRLKR